MVRREVFVVGYEPALEALIARRGMELVARLELLDPFVLACMDSPGPDDDASRRARQKLQQTASPTR